MKKKQLILTVIIMIACLYATSKIYNAIQRIQLTRGVKKAMAEYIQLPDFLEPVVIPVRYTDEEYNPVRIFSVPFKNSVGTFDLDNAAMVLEFKENDIDKKVIMHLPDDFPIGGEDFFGFKPINNNEIYYWGNGLMSLFGYNQKLNIGFGGETYGELFKNIVLLDADKYRFLCKMDEGITRLKIIELHQPIYPGDKLGYGNYTTVAKIDYERDVIITGGTDSWINNNTIFTYAPEKKEMYSYNYDLKAVVHPFSSYITEKKIWVRGFAVHPTLPFAVFGTTLENPDTHKDYHLYFLYRWKHQEKDTQLVPFPLQNIIYPEKDSINHFLYNFQFSPDGKWLLMSDLYVNYQNPDLYVFPVEDKNPLFIGKPLRLGKAFREETKKASSCWITDPLSYVLCDGMLLYKWDLSKIAKKE